MSKQVERKFIETETFLHTFYMREEAHPNKIYLRQPYGDLWKECSWAEVGEQARRMAAALHGLGLEKGDHVGIISKNCYHWVIADLAIMMGGFVSVPFYATLTAKSLGEVIKLSDTKALFVGKLEKWDKQKAGVPDDVSCIAFPHYEGNSRVTDCYEWDDFLAKHEPLSEPHQPKRDDLWTILYTSGTTGTPKGVMLTYEAPRQIGLAELRKPVYNTFRGASERLFSYLPLNHIAERTANEVTSIFAGGSISFTESLDAFADNLQSVQPTFFFAVPRIWTKFQQGILAKMPENRLNILLKIPIVKGVIKKKLRHALGLAEAQAMLSGAAPLPASTLEWFKRLDINIQEVYGASETTGGVTYNALDAIFPGTVGKPVANVEVKIDPETDEILIKCPWLMKGYYKDPQKSAEVLRNGYYHTGDVGHIDAHGNLVITGRIKDTFKSAKGQFILPLPIENKLVHNLYLEQVLVTGRGLPQPLALVILSEYGIEADRAEVQASLSETLTEINKSLPNYQKLGCLVIQSTPWTEESGFLTPTLKLKRHVIDQAFAAQYEKWLGSGKKLIWV